nr:hypothetical protein [uncultured Allomuricauda sp.]
MKQIVFVLITITLLGCGNKTPKNKADDTSSNQKSINSSCLSDLIEKNEIEKMINKEQVASIVGISVDNIEFEENKSSRAANSTVLFKWEPMQERTMTMEVKVGDRTISQTVPLKNSINIGRIDLIGNKKNQSALEYFDYTYGPKTKQEKEQTKSKIDQAQETSDQVNKKSAEALKSMVDKQTSNKVSGIGSSAFGSVQKASGMIYYNLKVLHGDTMFEITTDVSDDSDEDIRIAKEIAQQIINNCN